MVLSVLHLNEVTPPQLPTVVVTGLHVNEVPPMCWMSKMDKQSQMSEASSLKLRLSPKLRLDFMLLAHPWIMMLCHYLLSTDAIDVNVCLLGGKVHGSLSRAGKVKGQTPKVEKKEKKKAKTGRAKRRIQYNRRFVNVVATFGKKRGPNSNS